MSDGKLTLTVSYREEFTVTIDDYDLERPAEQRAAAEQWFWNFFATREQIWDAISHDPDNLDLLSVAYQHEDDE